MQSVIFKKLNHILNLNKNICYKQITKINNNELHIVKSKYTGSSITEVREITNIQYQLEQFNDSLEINIASDKVILKYK